MSDARRGSERLLVIDTCGERAAVGLSAGTEIVGVRELPDRSASAQLVVAIQALLAEMGWTIAQLDGVGVVNGPGSFTGVRVGLAAAKGLCEAAGLPLAAASRLAVLAEAGDLRQGFAALNAGREELYVREVSADGTSREFLCSVQELLQRCGAQVVVIAEEQLLAMLAGALPKMHRLELRDAVAPLLRCLREGGTDLAIVEANYVRGESDIYRRQAPVPKDSAAL